MVSSGMVSDEISQYQLCAMKFQLAYSAIF